MVQRGPVAGYSIVVDTGVGAPIVRAGVGAPVGIEPFVGVRVGAPVEVVGAGVVEVGLVVGPAAAHAGTAPRVPGAQTEGQHTKREPLLLKQAARERWMRRERPVEFRVRELRASGSRARGSSWHSIKFCGAPQCRYQIVMDQHNTHIAGRDAQYMRALSHSTPRKVIATGTRVDGFSK
jgi:hypothetical protein